MHVCLRPGIWYREGEAREGWKGFYTTKGNGTGLGLMIIFKIIKEHQGSIAIQSSVGIGTKVEISLPTV